ncbi:MAG TPA: ABC transporter permease [Nocardioides sp.]|jgi:lipooligosaccharide transport system permease protein|uniref:ABC transporter permease n=1 Tax=Nocardioides sp. TaxID=35761 RepID=UPI002E30C5EC|nr:ABC transporter permease [Nocardioides sp.]HEX3929100.1 ABC transporter permease [Nocardioides sp.]
MASTSPAEVTSAPFRDDRALTAWQGVGRQLDYHWTVYKRTWKSSAVSSFLSPLLYVVAMGVLLGRFVHVSPARLEGATSYLAFIVPGLIAAQAMQTALFETTYPVLAGIKWHKSFWAQLATPLATRDLANAMLAFAMFRVATTCGVYFLVMAPFGVFATWWGPLLAWLATVLVGMAFATWTFALSARVEGPDSFGLVFRLGMIPLFLFSGSFFPISNLGPVLAWVARCTPLWHGVSLTRMLCVDDVDPTTAAVNVAVLTCLLVVGWWLAVASLRRRLAT